MELFFLISATVAAYFIGFPYSYIAGNLIKGVDLRKQGSGNLGASNTLRVLGKKAGIAVLMADLLKGVLVVLVLPLILFRENGIIQRELFTALVAAAVIAGHNWPVLLKFEGGKGVAVTLGVFLAIAPVPTLLSLSVLIILIAATRFISLGAIAFGVLLAPLMIAFNYNGTLVWLGLVATISIIVQHRSNIKRLIHGNENKLGRNKGNV